jgi:hypothetical protein
MLGKEHKPIVLDALTQSGHLAQDRLRGSLLLTGNTSIESNLAWFHPTFSSGAGADVVVRDVGVSSGAVGFRWEAVGTNN